MVSDLAVECGLQQPLRQLLQPPALASQLQPVGLGPGDELLDELPVHAR
ncbi:hypothetical protein FHS40_008063 [Streptomyces spectabilis]|uniref:Uncharacterized protein n=1 Tax=Streptomyces spectabilis TaxID=68270 RepID=A0A7W8B4W9_STRST|nr:hypothetical protein [Streptomyces spectabilis]